MEVPTVISRFHLFSSLPSELRSQIWRAALLPHSSRPTLYPFQKGCCWRCRYLTESDVGYRPGGTNRVLEWHHDLLDGIEIEVPLVFVNREARGIALDWTREQGIEIGPREGGQQPIFSRPFNPTCDALYVPAESWHEFVYDPMDTTIQTEFYGQDFEIRTELTRLAVPEELLRGEHAAHIVSAFFRSFYRYLFKIESLLIIVNEQPDLPPADPDVMVPSQWEFEDARRGAFFWNKDQGGFDFQDGERVGDDALYKLIQREIDLGIRPGPSRRGSDLFEIRLVFAVRK